MAVLSVIVGILLILGGICCIVTPLATFLATGYILCIILLVFGVMGIVRAFQKKAHALEVVSSILAIIVGIVALTRPGGALVFDGVLVYLMAAWLLVQGVSAIVIGIQSRPESGWVFGLIAGILCVLLGIYAFIRPEFMAVTAGVLLGFFIIAAGVSLISFGAMTNE